VEASGGFGAPGSPLPPIRGDSFVSVKLLGLLRFLLSWVATAQALSVVCIFCLSLAN
jgi:hypothetical protein